MVRASAIPNKASNKVKLNPNSHLKTQFNHSPIKTRFNVRQTLLLSLKPQEYKKRQDFKLSDANSPEKVNLKKNKEKSQKMIINKSTNSSLLIKSDRNRRKSEPNDRAEIPKVKKSKKFDKNSKSLIIEPSVSKQKSFNGDLFSSSLAEKNSMHSFQINSKLSSTTLNHSLSPVLNNNSYDFGSLISQQSNLNNSQQQLTDRQNSLISNANMANITSSIKNNLTNYLANGSTVNISSNPVNWTTTDVCKYLTDNKFETNLLYLIQEHELDGQSFLMLNLPTIQNYMNLKLGPAIKLSHLVEKLKMIYFQQYQNQSENS